MLNEKSLAAVAASRWGPSFRKPLYDSYCFAQLPQTLRWLLAGGAPPGLPPDVFAGADPHGCETVVLFLVDAFGWRFVEETRRRLPFFRDLAERGTLSAMTSQFPSTTAAHVTTIHTGLPVNQSGVYEWNYYEPLVGTLISPLPFAFQGQPRNSLRHTGVSPADLYPRRTLYHELAEAGVHSVLIGGTESVDSPYSDAVHQGAETHIYRSLPEALVMLRESLAARRGKTYVFVYFDKIDAMNHRHGPDSPHVWAEIEAFWLLFERLFFAPAEKELKDVLLLMTADHGHVGLGPDSTIYLNREAPDVVPCIQTDRLGRPLARAGSRRDQFLHVRPEHLDAVRARLAGVLDGRGEVHRVDALIAEGLFGPGRPSEAFLARVGNLAVLPYAGHAVWWSDSPVADRELKSGAHGGLTPEEADIPLLAYRFR